MSLSNLEEDLKNSQNARPEVSLSASTIEYSAEMLDNQELYDRMHNRMQGGEYKGILMRLSLPR